MKYSFKIGSAWGIPIELHITFLLLMVAVFILSYPQLYFFLLVLTLFAFVVLHELSHSIIAKHYGIRVSKIVLYPIGGASQIDEIPDNPRIEWRMAIAGPLASFAIGAFLLTVSLFITAEAPATLLTPSVSLITTGNLLHDLAMVNIVLGAFNMVPAFPMDGGRILRAFLAERMKFSDATTYAASIGKVLGIAMATIGILYDFWYVVIGIFIYIGATEETESTIVSTTIARVRVKDVMHPEVASARPETTLTEALEMMFKARYHDIIVEKDGALNGIVTWAEIIKVKPEQRNELRVEELPIEHISVFPDDSILEAYKIMTQVKIDLVPVVDRGTPTKVVGVVTSEGVAHAYQKSKAR